ncbi:hypothetical protein D3OALGA1CA_899 [Olavius algarvensis associated proteobacterium Delta 3]|nr:hypothetical protein D3OALGA1CA_899 [Olavius algarvensis associated proteobacterium Delta 3]CAB5143925.1 hypothetical protein D3OALGB2SA_4402 [Olavius algarvensis associated proteobacterium Delta 3]
MRHPGWEGGASFSQGVFSFYIRDAGCAENYFSESLRGGF